jgi:phosphoribosylaminoimidazole-succinocarboxamide synthase
LLKEIKLTKFKIKFIKIFMNTKTILTTDFPMLKKVKSGKVREIYEVGENLLMVATDRLSAFDVIMNQGIPYKGIVLTQISKFWFDFFKYEIPNHVVETEVQNYPEELQEYAEELKGRSMLVRKAEPIPLECIVRGYISGSGWKDYQEKGEICGIKLPPGLKESDKLPEPIFTPSTKAEIGIHDENITEEKAIEIVGKETFAALKEKAIKIYSKAAEYALTKGIILADTKMEFGIYKDEIILIDELLTPDSSRFWPLDDYSPGGAQKSFDKQYVRDYLLSINFNKKPPAPDLPEEVINNTSRKYLEVFKMLTGTELNL